MELQVSTGAVSVLLGSVLPFITLIRWVKTPHKVSHDLMEKRIATIYDYFIPEAIKAKESEK